jgi:hypothetical protein
LKLSVALTTEPLGGSSSLTPKAERLQWRQFGVHSLLAGLGNIDEVILALHFGHEGAESGLQFLPGGAFAGWQGVVGPKETLRAFFGDDC